MVLCEISLFDLRAAAAIRLGARRPFGAEGGVVLERGVLAHGAEILMLQNRS